MKHFKLSTFILLIISILFTGSAYASANSATTLGETLEKNLFTAVADKNWQQVNELTAPAFQSINADKIRDRTEALAYIQSLDFKNYKFSDFHVTENTTDNMLIVTYKMAYAETVAAAPEAGKQVKNLSVWKKTDGKWLWVAHAVID